MGGQLGFNLKHEVWASSFQASGLDFDVLGMRSGLPRFMHQVQASTSEAFGLGADVSGLRSGLRRFRHQVYVFSFLIFYN